MDNNRLTAAAAARNNVRSLKTYRLTNGIPKELGQETAARMILVAIARRRRATAHTIRKAMPRGFSDATLRFYLGKFQRNGVVVSEQAQG
jgi:hypothetical protein